jgi:hypothetical protein
VHPMPAVLDAEGIEFNAGQSRMGNVRLRWTLSSANVTERRRVRKLRPSRLSCVR